MAMAGIFLSLAGMVVAASFTGVLAMNTAVLWGPLVFAGGVMGILVWLALGGRRAAREDPAEAGRRGY
jgi:hypothetical protein